MKSKKDIFIGDGAINSLRRFLGKTLGKIAEGLGIEVIELFRFHHEERDPAKLKNDLLEVINQIEREDTGKLQLILKIIYALK